MSRSIETGEALRRKFGGRWFHRIQPANVGPGDIIEFRDTNNRYRCKKVKGRTKKGLVITAPTKYGTIVVEKSRRIPLVMVFAAWTKRKED